VQALKLGDFVGNSWKPMIACRPTPSMSNGERAGPGSAFRRSAASASASISAPAAATKSAGQSRSTTT